MSRRHVEEGVHGGVDLLDAADRTVDKELEEATEPQNVRSGDQLDLALAEVLKRHPGGHIVHFQRGIMQDGMREQTIIFDRFYWELNLLVMLYGEPLSEPDRKSVQQSLAEHEAWANKHNFKFLAIVGSAKLSDLEEALA